jgi:hypothetical protein
MIKKEGDRFVLYSKDGKKKLGDFATEEEAKEREKEILRLAKQDEANSMGVAEWLASRAPSEVATLTFLKTKYDVDGAREWAKANGFKTGEMTESDDAIIFAQVPRDDFVSGSLRIIDVKDGISTEAGRLKDSPLDQLVLYRGEAFSRHTSGRYAKDIVALGTWFHPETKRRVNFDDDRIKRLVKQTSRYIANGNRIPFPDGHSFKAADNLGYWTGPFIDRGGRLIGVVEPRGKDVDDKLATGKIDQVSAYISHNYVDTKGNFYPEVITHVCATSYPVLTGQRPFDRLSSVESDKGPISGFLPLVPFEGLSGKGDDMKFAKLAATLGLNIEGKSEDEVLTMIETEIEARAKKGDTAVAEAVEEAKEGALSAFGAELKARGLKLDGGKVVEDATPATKIKDDDDAEKRALKEHLARVDLDLAKSKVEKAVAYARDMVAAGKIPPHVAEKVEKLCLIGDEAKFTALSTDKSAVVKNGVDAFGLFREIMEAVPGFGKGLSTIKGEKAKTENEEAAEYGRKVSRRVQGRKDDK